MINKKRPINLNLTTMKFPIMAIVSGLHRLSGIILFLFMPIILYFLMCSLAGPDDFINLQIILINPYVKLLLWAFTSTLIYHLIAGMRHLLMDLGIAEEVNMARNTAIIVILLALIFTIFLGIWIW